VSITLGVSLSCPMAGRAQHFDALFANVWIQVKSALVAALVNGGTDASL
jgi:hypothetical protein